MSDSFEMLQSLIRALAYSDENFDQMAETNNQRLQSLIRALAYSDLNRSIDEQRIDMVAIPHSGSGLF